MLLLLHLSAYIALHVQVLCEAERMYTVFQ